MDALKLISENGRFARFPIDRIIDNTTTDFDLFLSISDHLVLYGALGYKWQKSELESLLGNGHTHFMIRPEDLPKVRMYEQLAQLPFIDKNQAPKERIQTIDDLGAAFVKCLYEGDITEGCVIKAKTIGESLVECVMEEPACIQAISGLMEHDYYTYYHSVRVATYAVAIALEMGLSDTDKLRELALGGIFHDIGKKQVDLSVLNKRGPLTDNEWKSMRAHPQSGHVEIETVIGSLIPKEIILHHHEKMDGSGYPHGLDKTALLPEVQIATLADVFDALTSTRAYQNKRSRYEALDFMKHRMIGDKLPKEAFAALISCLAK